MSFEQYNNDRFEHYNNFSKEDQLKLLRKNGWIIKWIKNPSEELQLEAIKENPFSIRYIENPSEEMQLEAIEAIGAICCIKNPTKQVQLEAIKKFPGILDNIKSYINNPCQEVLDLLMIKDIIE